MSRLSQLLHLQCGNSLDKSIYFSPGNLRKDVSMGGQIYLENLTKKSIHFHGHTYSWGIKGFDKP